MISMTLEQLEESLERGKAKLGLAGDGYVLPNCGVSRTPEKRALLEEMKRTAEERGYELPFKGNF